MTIIIISIIFSLNHGQSLLIMVCTEIIWAPEEDHQRELGGQVAIF